MMPLSYLKSSLIIFCIFVSSTVLMPVNAIAQDAPTNLEESEDLWKERSRDPSVFFSGFMIVAERALKAVESAESLQGVEDRLFHIFVVIMVINLATRFAFGSGVTTDDILRAILMIGLTRVLMISYPAWSGALAGTGFYIGEQIGIAANVAFGAWEIVKLIFISLGMLIISPLLWIFGFSLYPVLAILFLLVLIVVLALTVFLAVAWALFGIAAAKMIGWLVIPFLLSEKLSFIFEGWLKLFIGLVFYTIMIEVNMVLIYLAARALFGANFGTDDSTIMLSTDNAMQTIGLMGFCVIGIFSLASTGRFAKTITGGIGGFGDSLKFVVVVAIAVYTKGSSLIASKVKT